MDEQDRKQEVKQKDTKREDLKEEQGGTLGMDGAGQARRRHLSGLRNNIYIFG